MEKGESCGRKSNEPLFGHPARLAYKLDGPYVFRHQLIADFKMTLGGGEDVAAAAGQGTDSAQSHYAAMYGRKREGIISVTALRLPRCGNVERARAGEFRIDPSLPMALRRFL